MALTCWPYPALIAAIDANTAEIATIVEAMASA
jgi:hypothetical protein